MESKPIIRSIKIPGDTLTNKVRVLSFIIGGELAAQELNTLIAIIKYSTNNSLFITTVISKQLQDEFGVNSSGFSTSLFRLAKKGLIKKDSKTVILNPIFTGCMDDCKFLLTFLEDPVIP